MKYIGIDIGSTASKVAISENDNYDFFVLPTGWNSKLTSEIIKERLKSISPTILEESKIVATGYGRISVSYADKVVTEISCHGKGGYELAKKDCTIIDVGGQDTKLINVKNGKAIDFLMNDKCAAGTGKFIEVMADRLGLTIDEMFNLAQNGTAIPISSLCTVFAESEVINYMGEGKSKEDLAAGVIDSVANKVVNLMQRKTLQDTIIITGGLSHNAYFSKLLSNKLNVQIIAQKNGRYAGALGAAVIAKSL